MGIMGLFGKLFGKNEEKEMKEQTRSSEREEAVIDGERFHAAIKNRALFILGESIKGLNYKEYRIDFRRGAYKDDRFKDVGYIDDRERVQAEYVIDFEYVVTDEAAFAEVIDTTAESSIEDGIFCILQEKNIIFVRDMENPSEHYETWLKEVFNETYSDWGIICTKLVFRSLEPTEEYREFYTCYKDLWI